jgi:polysaccharide deacetylase family protein (PEP-CTERM system associated)
VFKLNRDEFRREVAEAKDRIEDIISEPVRGHRAPAFSIMPQTSWALEVLAEEGFSYDSSIFPIAGRRYGWPDFRTEIHEIPLADGRCIIEAPLSTIRLFGRRFPVCGGGYLRHFPGFLTRWAMQKVQRERPAVLYTHPYEIEKPAPPLDVAHLDKTAASRTRRFHRLQQRNRDTVERKLISLLHEFEFAPLWEVINQVLDLRNRAHAHSPA